MTKSILYFADIHGPEIVAQRSIKRNFSLAGTPKVIALCKALILSGNIVSIYSLGSPAERSGKYYNKISETLPVNREERLTIYYGSSIDNRLFRGIVGAFSAAFNLPRIFNRNQIDTVIIYNLTVLSTAIAVVARIMGKHVYLDYEDSVKAMREESSSGLRMKIFQCFEFIASKNLNGVFGASMELIRSINVSNKLFVPGILGEDLITAETNHTKDGWSSERPIRLVYAGGFDESKGIDRFLRALEEIGVELEMQVCGTGPQSELIRELCLSSKHNIKFRGLVDRAEMLEIFNWADVGINPHRSDMHCGGSWPFKVIEYLAIIGTVFCSRTNELPHDLESVLYIYQGNTVSEIRNEFEMFLKHIEGNIRDAEDRRKFVSTKYSAPTIGHEMQEFLHR